jgi:predicted transcriptional regulator
LNSWIMDPASKRRDKLSIIAEILEIAKNGTLKTQIMYKANLSFAQLNEYLKFMLKIRLLDKLDATEKEVYIATDKGLDFLQRHSELTELLKDEDENGRNGKNGVRLPPQNLLKKT